MALRWCSQYAEPFMEVQEISEETGIPISELHLSKDNLERALMAKLMEDITEEWPLHYLMASYNRLSDELRSLTTIGDQAVLERVTDALIYGKQLTVSYSGLLLSMDMFPQVPCCTCSCNLENRSMSCTAGHVHSDERTACLAYISESSERSLRKDPPLQSMVTCVGMYQHWQACFQ